MTDIKIDQEAMQALVLKSILDSWDDETRDSLVTQALESLLKGSNPNQSWHDKSTVLDKILEAALREAARDVVAEMVRTNPKYVKQIEAMVSPLIETTLADSTLYLDQAIATALVATIKEKRGY